MAKKRNPVLDYLVYVVVRLFVCLVQALPMRLCQQVADGLAVVACDWLRLRGNVVDENLRRAFPEMTARQRIDLCRRMWRHLVLMVCEIAHLPRKVHDTNWRQFITLPPGGAFNLAHMDPRPLVIVSGHFGNFEAGGYIAGLFGFPTVSVARKLDNPFLDRFVTRFRGLTGQRMIDKEGSAAEISQILEDGGALCLLGDQYAGPRGCWVEFFGQPASCHKAISLFALGTPAQMIVAYAKRGPRPMTFELGLAARFDPDEPAAARHHVASLTQLYNRALEDAIRQAPEQYWWVHRRWKDTRSLKQKRRDARRAARAA